MMQAGIKRSLTTSSAMTTTTTILMRPWHVLEEAAAARWNRPSREKAWGRWHRTWLSSMTTSRVHHHDNNNDDHESSDWPRHGPHCETCTCQETALSTSPSTRESPNQRREDTPPSRPEFYPCGTPREKVENTPLPPPLPEPRYTFRRRVLPDSLTALDSPEGSRRLLQALSWQSSSSSSSNTSTMTAAPYFALMSHFTNQTDPAYCGITTLLVVLNALAVDPAVRWRGGWRYFGNEDVLLHGCCVSRERIRRGAGIDLEEFARLAHCRGMRVTLKRPIRRNDDDDDESLLSSCSTPTPNSVDDFRKNLLSVLTATRTNDGKEEDENGSTVHAMAVVSFSRSAMNQTGEGHFSPVAAYHAPTDSVLVLDVARFKYPPYWVSIDALYEAMLPKDSSTQQPRGWFLLEPPPVAAVDCPDALRPYTYRYRGTAIRDEGKLPAHLVPSVEKRDSSESPCTSSSSSTGPPLCPMQSIKVEYCPINKQKDEQ